MENKYYQAKEKILLEAVEPRLGTDIPKELTGVVANTVDASLEKHVPIIEEKDGGVLVRVGATPHPMEEVHYIMWVAIISDREIRRKYLNPNEAPEAFFDAVTEPVTALIYCNIHGLWQSN